MTGTTLIAVDRILVDRGGQKRLGGVLAAGLVHIRPGDIGRARDPDVVSRVISVYIPEQVIISGAIVDVGAFDPPFHHRVFSGVSGTGQARGVVQSPHEDRSGARGDARAITRPVAQPEVIAGVEKRTGVNGGAQVSHGIVLNHHSHIRPAVAGSTGIQGRTGQQRGHIVTRGQIRDGIIEIILVIKEDNIRRPTTRVGGSKQIIDRRGRSIWAWPVVER